MWNWNRDFKHNRPKLSSPKKRRLKEKYGYICLICGHRETALYSDIIYIHHIYPYGTNEEYNLLPLCYDCHYLKLHPFIEAHPRKTKQDWFNLNLEFIKIEDKRMKERLKNMDRQSIEVLRMGKVWRMRKKHPIWMEKYLKNTPTLNPSVFNPAEIDLSILFKFWRHSYSNHEPVKHCKKRVLSFS